MSQTVQVTSIIRKLYVEDNGKEVQVKQIDNPEDYGKGVKIYTKEAAKGVSKGKAIFAVSVEDFIPKKRTSQRESVEAMLASGLSADEIVARLTAK